MCTRARDRSRSATIAASSPQSGAAAGGTVFLNVVGARPNFMKDGARGARARAPRAAADLRSHRAALRRAHVAGVFFDELGMPRPNLDLGVGSGTHAEQTARVMVAFEKACCSITGRRWWWSRGT